MRRFEFAATAVALTLAGAAHAQTGGAPPPPSAPGPSAPELRGPDDRVTDFNRLRDDVARHTAGPTRSTRPIPASPGDIIAGREVRDSKGVVIGVVDTVGTGFAVVASPGGKIEVEFASFAKNNKGLLINMPKAKFDAIVAGNGKPAN
ncbi:hypothetical protein [Sphingomonas psychrotolerans]|uniref:PRC-barrel domain-containing protein n=1 Tax=Sphingomonas psychrotolerans TaxID=1327635 RepID=A0A2K8MG36_9SPHN|nr:hypothetical protein [Sphingomonas psychrotolerans]ATY32850.1 hypothetical protein CVN68_13435 [Sphingomonas psychrotolerans]